jgi:hypothetical protein
MKLVYLYFTPKHALLRELLASENIVEEELSTSIRLLRLMCELLISYDSCIRRRYNDEAATFNVIEEVS